MFKIRNIITRRTISIITTLAIFITQFAFLGLSLAADPKEDKTPFQRSVTEAVDERKKNGLPVPTDVSFEYTIKSNSKKNTPGTTNLPQNSSVPLDDDFTITAKTVIKFDNPKQAGHDKWPDLKIKKDETSQGIKPKDDKSKDIKSAEKINDVKEGDYTKHVKDKINEKIPGAWKDIEFGQEPRTVTFTETYNVTFPQPTNTPPQPTVASPQSTVVSSKSNIVFLQSVGSSPIQPLITPLPPKSVNEILMGFTYPGPNIDYSFHTRWASWWVEWYEFWAGYRLDWNLGLRLPMEVTVSPPGSVNEGTKNLALTTSARGLDWSEDKYMRAGVSPAGGNEFVAYFDFECGVWLEIFGSRVINYAIGLNFDHSASFVTPFGPGTSFPISPISRPFFNRNYGIASLSFGLIFTPQVSSERFTSQWVGDSRCMGEGFMTCTSPYIRGQIGPISAMDGPGNGKITMNNFRYYLNRCLIGLDVFANLNIWLLGKNLYFQAPFATFDLSRYIMPLSFGVHPGTPSSITMSIPVQNVSPTVNIGSFSDANVGQTFVCGGSFRDPGTDSWTASVDYGDGTGLQPLAFNPDKTFTLNHVYPQNGFFPIKVTVRDEDGGFGDATAMVKVNSVSSILPFR